MNWLLLLTVALQGGTLPPLSGPTAAMRPKELGKAGIERKLGTQVPLDATFRDETGKEVRLGDYCLGKPIVLQLAYYKCPMLCTQVMNGLFEALPKTGLSPNQYEVVIVSFDANEKPELASAKRQHYLEAYGRPGMANQVHFLTGQQPEIDRLCSAIGFTYSFDAKSGQFAHPGMVTVLTPTGTIARYFFGINLQPRDLRLGLVEASEGKINSAIDSFMLMCLYYDPAGATYAASILRIVRLGGIITVIGLGAGLVWAWRRERRPQPLTAAEYEGDYLPDTRLDLHASSKHRNEAQ